MCGSPAPPRASRRARRVRPVNETASRCHAHIDIGGRSSDYRLFDDRSAHGTTIVRNRKTISVPTGSRGVRLQSGDEIVLGEARLRVSICEA
jgi:predicted component of type VI protein secretion system